MSIRVFKYGIQSALGVTTLAAFAVAVSSFDTNKVKTVYTGTKQQVLSIVAPVSPTVAPVVEPVKAKRASAVDQRTESPSKSSPKEQESSTRIPVEPTFDVLRVEKDGALLVAGRAFPDSAIEIIREDGSVIGEGRTGPAGNFAIVLENTLAPGDYVLGISATNSQGYKTTSSQTAIIHIPGQEGDVLAMIGKQGEVSRIVVKPKSLEPLDPSSEYLPHTAVLSSVQKGDNVAAVVAKENAAAFTSLSRPVLKTKPGDMQHSVLVEAIEVEGGRLFVAGAVNSGEFIRIYIDNVAVGTARGTADNRFLLAKNFDLQAGKHVVRADVINEKTGGVWSRAEVDLLHEVPKEHLAVPLNKGAELETAHSGQKEPIDVAVLLPKIRNPSRITTPTGRGIKSAIEEKAENSPQQGSQPTKVMEMPLSVRRRIQSGKVMIIKPGDSLWRISRQTYGNGMRYTTIYNANRDQIRNPDRIYIGQIFKIPGKATH